MSSRKREMELIAGFISAFQTTRQIIVHYTSFFLNLFKNVVMYSLFLWLTSRQRQQTSHRGGITSWNTATRTKTGSSSPPNWNSFSRSKDTNNPMTSRPVPGHGSDVQFIQQKQQQHQQQNILLVVCCCFKSGRGEIALWIITTRWFSDNCCPTKGQLKKVNQRSSEISLYYFYRQKVPLIQVHVSPVFYGPMF